MASKKRFRNWSLQLPIKAFGWKPTLDMFKLVMKTAWNLIMMISNAKAFGGAQKMVLKKLMTGRSSWNSCWLWRTWFKDILIITSTGSWRWSSSKCPSQSWLDFPTEDIKMVVKGAYGVDLHKDERQHDWRLHGIRMQRLLEDWMIPRKLQNETGSWAGSKQQQVAAASI